MCMFVYFSFLLYTAFISMSGICVEKESIRILIVIIIIIIIIIQLYFTVNYTMCNQVKGDIQSTTQTI